MILIYMKARVKLMSDETIQNIESGNGIIMGIPVKLSNSRLTEIKLDLQKLIKEQVPIHFESHAIDRLVTDLYYLRIILKKEDGQVKMK